MDLNFVDVIMRIIGSISNFFDYNFFPIYFLYISGVFSWYGERILFQFFPLVECVWDLKMDVFLHFNSFLNIPNEWPTCHRTSNLQWIGPIPSYNLATFIIIICKPLIGMYVSCWDSYWPMAASFQLYAHRRVATPVFFRLNKYIKNIDIHNWNAN